MIKVVGLTHVGNVRSTNEDTILLEHLSAPQYVLVADGMGGHAAGEIASSIAAQAIQEHIASLGAEVLDGDNIVDAVQYANSQILAAIDRNPAYEGMGTTLTLAYLRPQWITVAHVGDSSCYLRRGNQLRKITRDHTYVQRLLDSGLIQDESEVGNSFRNVITRALGMQPVQVDLYQETWKPGDALLLCSDGLTAYADREHILRELSTPESPEVQAGNLLDYALTSGGRDNISVIVVHNAIDEKEDGDAV